MQINNKPSNLTIPFASGGAFNPIPNDSQIATSPNKASYTDGFPPATRTPRAAGGIPPDGLDMNGILHDLSNQMMWQQAVGILPWDSNFASKVGYPFNAIISYNGVLYQSQNDDNKATPTNSTAWGAVKGVTPQVGANDNQLATMAALQTAVGGLKGTASLMQNGYEVMPSGLIRQWGLRNAVGTGQRTDTFNFPIAFPNQCFQVRASDIGAGCVCLGASPASTTSANVAIPGYSLNNSATPTQVQTIGYEWEAIGF